MKSLLVNERTRPIRLIQPFLGTLALLLVLSSSSLGQTGKVSGRVTEATTGEPLPGVNVVIEREQQGATTDAEGYYTILNVSPGTYTVRASFVGYATQIVQGVEVNIDLTSTQNFQLQEQAVGLDEVTVQASQPVVRPDVSANVANINSDDIENMPVASVEDVIEMQAGIDDGLSIRGSDLNEVGFVVDGMSMRTGRQNEPFTALSYTSVKEVKVQTGGFNAEYGNVRSGLVNIVTKDAPRNRYIADAMIRYAPPQRDYFGNLPSHPDSYWMRPFVDDLEIPNDSDPAFVGTDSEASAWDSYTRRQYPQFEGWNAIADEWANDEISDNDLTVDQLQELFNWRHRKNLEVRNPDYEVDATVGGPIPLISSSLGDLRFLASYRGKQRAYFIPQLRDTYNQHLGRLKLTSNITPGMKLTVNGMFSREAGIQRSGAGFPNMFRGEPPELPWRTGGLSSQVDDGSSGGGAEVFANHTDNPSRVYRAMAGADFTHTLSPSTFHQIRFQTTHSDYLTTIPRERDYSTATTIGPMAVDEAPDGWHKVNIYTPSGMAVGGHWGKARDSTKIAMYRTSYDITSQLNRFAQVKTGVEYILSDYDVNHGQYELHFTSSDAPKYKWQRTTHQGAAYAQTKLEFEGMIANLGLRLDYWNPGGTWYEYDPYSDGFSPRFGKDSLDAVLEEVPVGAQFPVSPRLGVSFPVTTRSKLYFNYGHFRQMMNPNDLFLLRTISTGAIDRVGNPNQPLPRTVAYELGYEHSLFDQYLVRLSGYYKALDNQSRQVRYTSLDGLVDYRRFEPLNYEDIRGFELTLRKNAGRFVRGFVNYTFMSVKRGNFGFSRSFENRADQREFIRNSRAHYQNKPVAQPYARFNVEFLGPRDWGPSLVGLEPLGDWRLSILGAWREGESFTWSGEESITGFEDNVRWKDYWNLDLRLTKNFGGALGDMQFFVDVSNVLNTRHLRMNEPFQDNFDWLDYMHSLHLPSSAFEELEEPPYRYIPGSDEPGDYRTPGVGFQPIEIVDDVTRVGQPQTRPLYYEWQSKTYMTFEDGSWSEADPGVVDQVLEDKAYIDMPDFDYLRFFHPRQVLFGIRLSL